MSFKVFGRHLRCIENRAAGRVAAEKRALRAAQNLHLRCVRQRNERALKPRKVQPVDVERDGLFVEGARADDTRTDAADIELRRDASPAGVVHNGQIGNKLGEIIQARRARALGIGLLIRPWLGIENVDLVFLTAIVGIAVRFGLWPSLFASVIASLGYNFFFMEPRYTFTIADPTNVGAFFFFILMAVVVSNVAARVRTQAVAAMDRARTTEELYSFSKKLAGGGTLDDVLWATSYQTALMLKVRVVLPFGVLENLVAALQQQMRAVGGPPAAPVH